MIRDDDYEDEDDDEEFSISLASLHEAYDQFATVPWLSKSLALSELDFSKLLLSLMLDLMPNDDGFGTL